MSADLRARIAALFRWAPGEEPLHEKTPGEIADAVLAEPLVAEFIASLDRRCSCNGDPIECNHEAARGQAEALLSAAPTSAKAELDAKDGEIARLRRDLAEANRRYEERTPTQWAYEQACHALAKHRERAEQAERLSYRRWLAWTSARQRARSMTQNAQDWCETAKLTEAEADHHKEVADAALKGWNAVKADRDQLRERFRALAECRTGQIHGPDWSWSGAIHAVLDDLNGDHHRCSGCGAAVPGADVEALCQRCALLQANEVARGYRGERDRLRATVQDWTTRLEAQMKASYNPGILSISALTGMLSLAIPELRLAALGQALAEGPYATGGVVPGPSATGDAINAQLTGCHYEAVPPAEDASGT